MGKKVRTYDGYIQEKFSSSIKTDVLLNLSATQIKWIKETSFGVLLDFCMICYVHKLRYNVVDAFDSEDCSLNLKSEEIMINEMIVHNILGLSQWTKEIEFTQREVIDKSWQEQYSRSLISLLMVRDHILSSRRLDNYFKWNFMIIMYNFFFEANQN